MKKDSNKEGLSLIEQIKRFGIELKHNISYSEAFSLIELMISLIAISCITAAFAPVITKKLKATNLKVSVGGIKTRCEQFGGLDANGKMYCKACVATGCIACSKFCDPRHVKDDANCNCIACSTLGGANCETCSLDKCLKCDPGYFINSSGQCEACPRGSECTNGVSAVPCKMGYYQPNAAQANCVECPAGYYQAYTGKTWCDACPVGHYQPNTAQTAYSACTVCAAGYYQPNIGSASCIACAAGYYQNAQAKTSCIECPAGQYQDGTARTGCINLPAGCVSTATHNVSSTNCTRCASGYVAPAGSTGCTACTPGAVGIPGTISDAGYSTGGSACVACPTGWHSNTTMNECLIDECNAGYYILNNSCTACAAGYAASGRAVRYSCTACGVGYYMTSTGAASCTACSAGYYRNETAARTGCTACPAGQYQSSAAATGCSACGTHQYSAAGASSCSACGTYSYSYTYSYWRDNGHVGYCRTDQYSSRSCNYWGDSSEVTGTAWAQAWDC